jgi:hypothetical protein
MRNNQVDALILTAQPPVGSLEMMNGIVTLIFSFGPAAIMAVILFFGLKKSGMELKDAGSDYEKKRMAMIVHYANWTMFFVMCILTTVIFFKTHSRPEFVEIRLEGILKAGEYITCGDSCDSLKLYSKPAYTSRDESGALIFRVSNLIIRSPEPIQEKTIMLMIKLQDDSTQAFDLAIRPSDVDDSIKLQYNRISGTMTRVYSNGNKDPLVSISGSIR